MDRANLFGIMSNLVSLQYWFNPRPFPFLPVIDRGLMVLFGGLLVVAIILWIVERKHGLNKQTKRILRRIAEASFWLSVFGWILYGLVYQRIYILGARGWFLLWVALLAWYVWSIWQYVFVKIPEQKKKHEEREEIQKWLPEKKKK